VTNNEAMNVCNALMRFLEQQSIDFSSHLKCLRQISTNINQIQVNSKVQTFILDYFTKK
jgi:hypothetical protein